MTLVKRSMHVQRKLTHEWVSQRLIGKTLGISDNEQNCSVLIFVLFFVYDNVRNMDISCTSTTEILQSISIRLPLSIAAMYQFKH